MGLDISAGGISFRAGSYSGFAQFRDWLVQQIGHKNQNEYIDWHCENWGEWNRTKGMYKKAQNIPLGPLIGHSDCDGYLTVGDAKKLLPELLDIQKSLLISFPATNEEKYMREQLENWIDACQEIIEIGGKEKIYFG